MKESIELWITKFDFTKIDGLQELKNDIDTYFDTTK